MGVLLVTCRAAGGEKEGEIDRGSRRRSNTKNTIATFPYTVPSQHFPDSFYFPLFWKFFFPWVDLCLSRGLHVESGAFC